MARAIFLIVAILLSGFLRAETMPVVGGAAPGFALADQAGKVMGLDAWKGKWLVLYFYPKDETSGCTAEAIAFRDAAPQLSSLNAQVAGISLHDVASHKSFAKNHQINFTLLADTDGATAKRYGALTNLGIIKFAKRVTFIVDPEGKVAKVYPDVEALRHAGEVLADLKLLTAGKTAQ